jgi:hypothetical protein
MKIVYALMALLLFACNKPAVVEEALPGQWKVIDFKADMPDLSPKLLEGTKEAALANMYAFQADKSMSFNDVEKGIWTYDMQTKTLNIKYEEGSQGPSVEAYQIQEMTDTRMTWFQEVPELGSMTITLEKK